MLTQITGLHHVTSLARDAQENNDFFTKTLGLRRVKKTVNFDAPDVYHLYYGDEQGSPGSVMTYFPFPNAARGRPGAGEVGTTLFAIPEGARAAWVERLTKLEVPGVEEREVLGQTELQFDGPDGDRFALVETNDDRAPWTGGDVAGDMAIRGFHSGRLRLAAVDATEELLGFMGYETTDRDETITRMARAGGNGAHIIDLEHASGAAHAQQGAGSVHHIAFAVEDRAAQLEVRRALLDTGYQVTPVIDRDYFWAIYFRTPGGVLFEIATNEPGFDRDEAPEALGQSLMLPSQHAHLRDQLESGILQPIAD